MENNVEQLKYVLSPKSGAVVGAIQQIAFLGNDFLKQEVLPKLLSGETIITAAMSEPITAISIDSQVVNRLPIYLSYSLTAPAVRP